jgi:DNA-binding NarL/FixJ family response regulator
MSTPIAAIGLVRDLFFRSKLEAIASAAGARVEFASNIETAVSRLTIEQPTVIFVDLSDASFPAQATAAAMRTAAPRARLIGFASHVDLKAIHGAREAGFDLTLSRSEFAARLGQLLASGR